MTKTAMIQRCREIMKRYPNGKPLEGEDFAFVHDLLSRHENIEEKLGCGLATISVRAASYGTRCFEITRADGSKTDFSFMRCITNPSPMRDFKMALRKVIEPQIIGFRDKAFAASPVVKCAYSGMEITSDEAHVDHTPPATFDWIVNEFMRCHPVDLSTVRYVEGDGQMGNDLAPGELRDFWFAFHLMACDLRIVSKRANLSDIRKAVAR